MIDYPEMRWQSKTLSVCRSIFGPAFLFFVCLGGAIAGMQVSLVMALFFGVLSIPCFACVYTCWTSDYGAYFIINAEGIRYTSWKRTVPFNEIDGMGIVESQGRVNLVLRFKEVKASPLKFNLPPSLKVKVLCVSLSKLRGRPEAIGETIYRYCRHFNPDVMPCEFRK